MGVFSEGLRMGGLGKRALAVLLGGRAGPGGHWAAGRGKFSQRRGENHRTVLLLLVGTWAHKTNSRRPPFYVLYVLSKLGAPPAPQINYRDGRRWCLSQPH